MEERTGNFKTAGRKKGFNIVDLLLILFALSVVFFAVFVLDPFDLDILAEDDVGTEISYSVCLSGIESTYIEKIQTGDSVFDANTKQYLGVVMEVSEAKPHMVLRHDEYSGSYMQQVTGLFDVVVTIQADASFVERVGYSVEGKRIAVGAEYTMVFPNFAGKGYCISFENAAQGGNNE